MNELNKKKEELEKRLKELEDIAMERYFSNIDNITDFLSTYLSPEEYDEWSDLLDKLND